MISDLLALLGLIKELRQLTRRPADGLNFNIVKISKSEPPWPGHHMRIVNLLPMTICAVRFRLQLGDDESSRMPVNHIYHPSTNDQPFDKTVLYKIPVDQTGVFLYPRGVYYVRLDEYPNFDWDGDVRVKFYYSTPTEGEKEGNLQTAARAEVIEPKGED